MITRIIGYQPERKFAHILGNLGLSFSAFQSNVLLLNQGFTVNIDRWEPPCDFILILYLKFCQHQLSVCIFN